MKVYTSAQMREREQAAVDAGSSFEQLMENAGQAAAADLLRRCSQAGRVLVVCGKGNNGGDGLVMARVLQQHGWQVEVLWVLGESLSELASLNRERLLALPDVQFVALQDWLARAVQPDYDVIIEGIFGTGFVGALPDAVVQVCEVLNGLAGLKVALDMPTGLNGDTAAIGQVVFDADITYAFAAWKPAHLSAAGERWCGEKVCLDIGID